MNLFLSAPGGTRTLDLLVRREISRYTPTHASLKQPMKSTKIGERFRTVSAAFVPSSRTITRTKSTAWLSHLRLDKLVAEEEVEGHFAAGAFFGGDGDQLQIDEAVDAGKVFGEGFKDGGGFEAGFAPVSRSVFEGQHIGARKGFGAALKGVGFETFDVHFHEGPGSDAGAFQQFVERTNGDFNEFLAGFKIDEGVTTAVGGVVDAHACCVAFSADRTAMNGDLGQETVVAKIGFKQTLIERLRLDRDDFPEGTGKFAKQTGKVADVGANIEEVAAGRVREGFQEPLGEARFVNSTAVEAAADSVALIALNAQAERQAPRGDSAAERIGALHPIREAAHFVVKAVHRRAAIMLPVRLRSHRNQCGLNDNFIVDKAPAGICGNASPSDFRADVPLQINMNEQKFHLMAATRYLFLGSMTRWIVKPPRTTGHKSLAPRVGIWG